MEAGEEPPPERAVRSGYTRRWPAAVTVLVAIAMTLVLPQRLILGPRWTVPAVLGVFLVAIVVTDHERASRHQRKLRILSVAMVVVLAAGAAWTATHLVVELLDGSKKWSNARTLLIAGAAVWLYTNGAFAFVYWELDGGGAARRASHPSRYPDLAFPEHMNPDLAPPGWRPDFVDYLYLGFTNATAFSPTDVMPLRHWAKLAMALQAMISMALLTLVIANAVNLLV